MKIVKKTTINQPIDQVWQVWAEEFEKAQDWMGIVYHSYEKEEGEKVTDSPIVGRICEFSQKPDGPIAKEDILLFDRKNHKMETNCVSFQYRLSVVSTNGQLLVSVVTCQYQLPSVSCQYQVSVVSIKCHLSVSNVNCQYQMSIVSAKCQY